MTDSWQKNQKFWNVGKSEKNDEQCFFEEKTFSFFKTACLPKCEDGKYAGGSNPFVSLLFKFTDG